MTLDQLQTRLEGTLITAFHPRLHPCAKTPSDGAARGGAPTPAKRAHYVVRARSAADLDHALLFAAEHGLRVSARTGGQRPDEPARPGDMILDVGRLAPLAGFTTARIAGAAAQEPRPSPTGP